MRSRVGRQVGAALFASVLVALVAGVPASALTDGSTTQAPAATAPVAVVASAPVVVPAVVPPMVFNLCARTGSATMPGSISVPIWGFSLNPGTGCGPAQLPGPVLDVPLGTLVTVNLNNVNVPVNVSLEIPGVSPSLDTTGVAAGGTKTYVFTADDPGTYIYETGVGDQRGVLMGLYGALVVRSATAGQAYGTAGSAYNTEKVLVLSEIDQNFNANPGSFNLVNYSPEFWLINGHPYPDTNADAIGANSGDRVLLRYVNAGSLHHTMTTLGLRQLVIARDAYLAASPVDAVTETIPAGSTVDAIATVPASAPTGAKFPIFSRQLHLTNNGAFPGGMLLFLNVTTGVTNNPPTVDAGPNQSIGSLTANLDGTVTDDGQIQPTPTTTWSKISGPGTVTFGNAAAVDTTATFSVGGTYVLQLQAYDGQYTVSDTVTIIATPPSTLLYFSTADLDAIPGVSGPYDDADVYSWSGGSSYSRVFDGSTNGLGTGADIDALVVVDADTFYMSLEQNAGTAVPTLGSIQDEDVVKYDAGVWTLYFDGSDVGLADSNDEDVDAFDILTDGSAIVSTRSNVDVPGISGEQGRDLLRCAGTFGPTTTCTWTFYLDAGDAGVGLGQTGENIDGAAVQGGALYLSSAGTFSVPGLSGEDEDVFRCNSPVTGASSSCGSYTMIFDGSVAGVTGELDAIDRP
jgi:K319-like protein/multicopper oxidase